MRSGLPCDFCAAIAFWLSLEDTGMLLMLLTGHDGAAFALNIGHHNSTSPVLPDGHFKFKEAHLQITSVPLLNMERFQVVIASHCTFS